MSWNSQEGDRYPDSCHILAKTLTLYISWEEWETIQGEYNLKSKHSWLSLESQEKTVEPGNKDGMKKETHMEGPRKYLWKTQ